MRRILIVDDLGAMRKVLRRLLESLGFSEVSEARDASEALSKLKLERFDLVISDWNMPSMSGLDLLTQMRNDPKNREVPFIMLTAVADKKSVENAMSRGVSEYLTKPFSQRDLEKKLERIGLRKQGDGEYSNS
jgi:two-component system chemotaxis response regulator CheY